MIFQRCQRYANEQLAEIAFPLGGVGTGCVSLTGAGGLAEWQIRNSPDQDSFQEHTFFALRVLEEGGQALGRIVEGPVPVPFTRHQRKVFQQRFPGMGLGNSGLFGLPHFPQVTFAGAMPLARVTFADPQLPVDVELEAWSPFIPMNPEDSGIPCALFRFRLRNRSARAVSTSLVFSMDNLVPPTPQGGKSIRFFQRGEASGLLFSNELMAADEPGNGTLAVATFGDDVYHRENWHRLNWFDSLQVWWDEFLQTGRLTSHRYETSPLHSSSKGSLGTTRPLAPGASTEVSFWIAWSFPTYGWPHGITAIPGEESQQQKPRTATHWKNHYAHRFPDAVQVIDYLLANEPRLYRETSAFREALEAVSVPAEILEAVSANLGILRSPTVLRLEDGTFYAFEGCGETVGSCPGSCTHVWNYAQTLAFLFPTLQQGMHTANYRWNFSPTGSGAMSFRILLPLQNTPIVHKPAADGQLGEIIKVYQTWKILGDTEWLRNLWPRLQQAIDFAGHYWDWQQRGVIEGVHHNTYDIEFHGPDPMATSYYLGALAAVWEIAETLGDNASASRYESLLQAGAEWMETESFRDGYFQQMVDSEAWRHAEFPEEPRPPLQEMEARERIYQYGCGCLADQLVGKWMARVAGTRAFLDPVKEKQALLAIMRHNFRESLWEHSCCQRAYALQDEGGLLLCTWPLGGRERLPFVYCDEIWTGIEYQVAAHLLYCGERAAALKIVRAVRSRYDGRRRNPFNEFECGSWYARALSSWSLFPAWAGMQFDAAQGYLGFTELALGETAFWTLGEAWGILRSGPTQVEVCILGGRFLLQTLNLPRLPLERYQRASVTTQPGRSVRLRLEKDRWHFDSLRLQAGDILLID